MLKLSVIIVLYEEYKLVEKTLSSVYQNKIENMEIILVDNTPDNKGYKTIINKFPKIKYYHHLINSGFGGGVNFGLSKATGKYILMLTPDMYILPQTIKKTIAYIEGHERVGLVGSRLFSSPGKKELSANSSYPNLVTILYYYNMPLYKLVKRFNKDFSPNFFSAKAHERILETKWIYGQYMLARKKALADINGFDERFFLYFEDVDLCKRLVNYGWKVIYLPFGGVVQNGITKWKKTSITQGLSPYMESLYKFYKKHYGRVYAFAAWFVGAMSALISVPYLTFVVLLKKSLKHKSQSNQLLPLWIDIVKWHFSVGFRIIAKS
jgi:GT2 family glycosyltransferase